MLMPGNHAIICFICHHRKSAVDARLVDTIRPGVRELLTKKHPGIKSNDYVCTKDLKEFRQQYIENFLATEKGELTKLDHEVIKSLINYEVLAKNVNQQFSTKLTFGERLADKIAEFGGSWKFIILFGVVLVGWIILNAFILITRPFDPFPFILLNLILSCLAAIQAPVIMMSQNRREAKDRLRSENDYKVNLKSELQIRQLHEKMDYLMEQQWHRLIEIQQMQLELLEDRKKRR